MDWRNGLGKKDVEIDEMKAEDRKIILQFKELFLPSFLTKGYFSTLV